MVEMIPMRKTYVCIWIAHTKLIFNLVDWGICNLQIARIKNHLFYKIIHVHLK